MKRVRTFLTFDRKVKMLLIESYFYLAWARILKNRPFSKIVPILGKQMQETPFTCHDSHKEILSHISQSIHMMSRYTCWESQCLVKAIAAMKMLERRRIESTLYLGTAKDETGEFIAHAWLRSGPFYITGAVGKERFTVVNKFAREI